MSWDTTVEMDDDQEYGMDAPDLSKLGANDHSNNRKRRNRAKFRKKCKEINAPINHTINYLYYQLYKDLNYPFGVSFL